MPKLYYILWFLIIVFSWQCQPINPSGKQLVEKPHFDLAGYFEQEVDRLATKDKLVKIVSANGNVETKNFDSLDLSEELKIFRESDINKPAWIGLYEIDSVLTQNQLTKLNYTALKAELTVRKLQIDLKKGQVEKIIIDRMAETTLADSEYHLEYNPSLGYRIENKQDLKIGENGNFVVQVNF